MNQTYDEEQAVNWHRPKTFEPNPENTLISDRGIFNRDKWLSVFFDNISDLQLIVRVEQDGEFRAVEVNKAYIEISRSFGFKINKNNIIGKTIPEIARGVFDFDQRVIDTTVQYYQQVVQSKKAVSFEEKYVFDQGTYYAAAKMDPILDDSGYCQYIIYSSHDITDRKNQEIEIKKAFNEIELFRNMVETSTQGIGTANLDGSVRYQNPALLKLLSIASIEDAQKYDYEDFYTPDDRRFLRETVIPTVLSRGSWSGELPVRSLCGRMIPTIQNIYLLRNNEGEPMALSNVVQDISERKEAEKALQRSEERFRVLVESEPVAIGVATADGRIEYINPEFTSLFGYDLEDVADLEVWFQRAYPEPEYRKEVLRNWNDALAEAETRGTATRSIEIDVTCKDGRIKTAELVGALIGGKTYGVFIDLTERRRAEGAINAFFDQSLVMLLIADLKKQSLVRVNNEVSRITGRTKEELLTTPFIEFIHPADRKAMKTALTQLAEGKPLVGFQNRHLTAEKEVRHFEWNSIPDMERKLVYSMAQDITERKQIEAELDSYREQLEELVEKRTAQLEKEIEVRRQAERQIAVSLSEKEVLLREIHHRVKNNLNTVTNLLYLQSRVVEDNRIKMTFQESRNRIQTMARVHEFLYRSESLARIDMHDYMKQLTTDLAEAYPMSLVAMDTDASGTSLGIDQAIPCGLLVTEMVSNSLKYAFPISSSQDRISVRLSEVGDVCQLVVTDNGSGLPEGLDVENTRSLGLRLVGMLTKQLKGTCEVRSTPEQGTRFVVSFKVTEPMKEE